MGAGNDEGLGLVTLCSRQRPGGGEGRSSGHWTGTCRLQKRPGDTLGFGPPGRGRTRQGQHPTSCVQWKELSQAGRRYSQHWQHWQAMPSKNFVAALPVLPCRHSSATASGARPAAGSIPRCTFHVKSSSPPWPWRLPALSDIPCRRPWMMTFDATWHGRPAP
jgi:hypothetical protein